MKKLGLLALISFFALSCSTNKGGDIKIGWIGVLTGEAAPYGIAVKKGTELAVDEINSAGGINGRKLVVEYEDDQADPKTGIAAMNKLIESISPPVIIQAAASSVMLANIPIAEKHKIVYISPTCSNDKIADGGEYIYRIWPSDSYQGRFIARYVVDSLKDLKASVINIQNDFGIGLRNTFHDEFAKLGGKIVSEESFNEGATDMRSQLEKIRQSRPDIIFIPSHVKETAIVLRQARELGIRAQFIADAASYSPELIKNAGSAAEGLLVTTLQFDSNSKDTVVEKFVHDFTAKYNEVPDIYAAAGYDCMDVIADAMKKIEGDVTADSVKYYFDHMTEIHGVTGAIMFDAKGEVQKNYTVYVVQNGAFVRFN